MSEQLERARLIKDIQHAKELMQDAFEAATDADEFQLDYVRDLLRAAQRCCDDAKRNAAFMQMAIDRSK